MPHVRISAIGHPDVVAELDIPVRYDAAFAAHFSGRPGFNGTSGGDGHDGGAGDPGQAVHIWVTLKSDTRMLLQVRAASPDGTAGAIVVSVDPLATQFLDRIIRDGLLRQAADDARPRLLDNSMDRAYLEHWAERLGVLQSFEEISR